MKTKSRIQNQRNLERLTNLAVRQNNQEDLLWLEYGVHRLEQATRLLHRRARVLGAPLPETDSPPAGATLRERFYILRSGFWSVQALLGNALLANEALSSGLIMDMTMANSKLAQSLSCDFRRIGFNESPVDKETMLKEIGKRIADKRREKKLSQAVLGEAAGLSGKSVARIEGAKQRLSVVALYLMAHALGVSVADLIPDEALAMTPDISPEKAAEIQAAWPAFHRALEELKKGKKGKKKFH